MPKLLRKAAKVAQNKIYKPLSEATGVASVARVGGNLAQNIKNTAQGKPREYLYKKGDVGSLAKDALGLATFGASTVGAVRGLAGKPVSKNVKEYIKTIKNPNADIPVNIPKNTSLADRAAKEKLFRGLLQNKPRKVY